MRREPAHIIIGFITALLSASMALADDFHPLGDIRKRAEEFATRQVDGSDNNTVVESGALDPRLRLPRCQRPLDAEQLGQQQRNSPNITVTIKCQGDTPWTVHVPVKISTFTNAFIATRPLPRGVAIQLADLRQERREISQLSHGYFENADTVVGRIPKRSLPKGAVVSPGDLEQNRIIKRGNQVTIVATSGGITVRMPGKALSDAGEGDLIKVENISSQRVIEAVASRPGIVEVRM